jgi:hypothetical protein
MRYIIVIAFLVSGSAIFSQPIADSGKLEFKRQAQKDTPDYKAAYRILSNQVKQYPDVAELRYFLAYAIDRLNSDDAKTMTNSRLELTIEASEHLEKVNRLEPVYKGEVFILGPYSKISSIWGSLAFSYLHKNLPDSANWAFKEGKRRGGFIEPILSFNRQLLNSCEMNSILITYGDNNTIACWYLQNVENYRNDITILDANMLNTAWYVKYLKHQRKLAMSLSNEVIDTMNYKYWTPQSIRIIDTTSNQKLEWNLKPTYLGQVLLMGDRVLLDILQQNFFKKTFYFTGNSDTSYNLFLTDHLLDMGLVNKISPEPYVYTDTAIALKNLASYSIENLSAGEIQKSGDAIYSLNNFRWAFYTSAYRLIANLQYDEAKKLLDMMNRNFNPSKLPYVSEEHKKYFTDLYEQVK